MGRKSGGYFSVLSNGKEGLKMPIAQDIVQEGAEKIHTSSAVCLGPLAAAAAYDMIVEMRGLLKNERLYRESKVVVTHGR